MILFFLMQKQLTIFIDEKEYNELHKLMDMKIKGVLDDGSEIVLYNLYTGKVGYLLPYTKGFLPIVLITLLGNIVGVATIAFLFRATGISAVVTAGSDIFALKIGHEWYETLALSILCGMMMYIAVDYLYM